MRRELFLPARICYNKGSSLLPAAHRAGSARKGGFAVRRALVLLLCLLLPWTALGEDNAQIVTFPTFSERVKLREQPNDSARVLGQYYGGQPVEILEDGKSWHMVSIGGRTGYMMQKYLTDLAGDAAAPEGVLRYPDADGTLPLYDQAGGTGHVIARMQGGTLQVLGTVSQEWLHVRYTSPEGAVTCGFASALCITWPEGISRLQVDTGGTNEKLHLRAEPSTNAESLGLYYTGAVVYALIEDSPTRGWTHVRVGGETGYMLSSQLAPPDASTPLPAGTLRQASCPFYASATDEEPAGTLFAAAEFVVTAEQGGRCQLMLGSEAAGDAEWVWVDSQYIQYGYMTVGTPAPSATASPSASPAPAASDSPAP